MTENRNLRICFKKVASRALKATLWSLIVYLFLHFSQLLVPILTDSFSIISIEQSQLLNIFTASIVFFSFTEKFFSKTHIEYTFSVAKSFITLAYLLVVFDGGIINLTIPVSSRTIELVLDLRNLLALLVFPVLLSIVKSFIHTINYLEEKNVTEKFQIS